MALKHCCILLVVIKEAVRLIKLTTNIINTDQINGLVQERRNFSVLAMELRFSCTNPSKLGWGMDE